MWAVHTRRYIILLLSIGCPLIHEYSTNLLLCATTDSTLLFLSAWLISWRFRNQPASHALLLILPFSVFPLCACTHLVRDLFLMFHCLEQSPLQSQIVKHTHILQVIFEISPLQAVLLIVCMRAQVQICFDCVLFLCFVMDCVLQSGEIAH